MVAQSPHLSIYHTGVVVGYVRQGAEKERRWLGLTELMVAMAVVAIAAFVVRIKL